MAGRTLQERQTFLCLSKQLPASRMGGHPETCSGQNKGYIHLQRSPLGVSDVNAPHLRSFYRGKQGDQKRGPLHILRFLSFPGPVSSVHCHALATPYRISKLHLNHSDPAPMVGLPWSYNQGFAADSNSRHRIVCHSTCVSCHESCLLLFRSVLLVSWNVLAAYCVASLLGTIQHDKGLAA